jgi:hypothetical protein
MARDMLSVLSKELVMLTYWRIGAVAVLGALAGASYVFVPSGQPPAVRTVPLRIPAESPTGRIEVSSFGMAELTPDRLPPMQVLHARIALANDLDDSAWQFDARTTQLEIGAFTAAPLFVNADELSTPSARIPRQEQRELDLYFTVPPTVRRDEDIARFTIAWQVRIGDRAVIGRSAFDGVQTDEPGEGARTVGTGLRWWADPAYPWGQFHRTPGPIVPRPPTRIVVTQAPRGEPFPPTPCDQW